jgi:hypothetical protein
MKSIDTEILLVVGGLIVFLLIVLGGSMHSAGLRQDCRLAAMEKHYVSAEIAQICQ